VAIVLTLFGFVVLGELVLMTYYPDPALVEISWPAAPRPPRMAQLPTAVEPPDDLPADLSVGPRTSLPRAPAKAE
jgi:hypothetical protein